MQQYIAERLLEMHPEMRYITAYSVGFGFELISLTAIIFIIGAIVSNIILNKMLEDD